MWAHIDAEEFRVNDSSYLPVTRSQIVVEWPGEGQNVLKFEHDRSVFSNGIHILLVYQ